MGYTIWPDGLTGDVLSEVNSERLRQEELKRKGKFLFSCADSGLTDPEKLSILTEEFGEVAKEVTEQVIGVGKIKASRGAATVKSEMIQEQLRNSQKRIREELIQVAAVAIAWVESLSK